MTRHDGMVLAQRENLVVVDCTGCGYAHLGPLPDDADLERFYSHGFWEREKAGEYARYREQAAWWRTTHDDWLGALEQHVPAGRRSLLDIGCGYGMFLERALLRGWDAIGIEPSRSAAEVADPSGRRVYRGALDSFPSGWMGRERYGAVTALWVLEHIVKADAFLEAVRARLAPGGMLLLVVPNEWTPMQAAANKATARPFWWLDRTHVNYFSWASLGTLLDRHGFEIVYRLCTYQMETFILSGFDYPAQPELGRECHARVEQADLVYPVAQRLTFYHHMALKDRGRDIVAFARAK